MPPLPDPIRRKGRRKPNKNLQPFRTCHRRERQHSRSQRTQAKVYSLKWRRARASTLTADTGREWHKPEEHTAAATIRDTTDTTGKRADNMTSFNFYLDETDAARLFAVKQMQGQDDLTGNEYAKKLLADVLYKMFPSVPEFDEEGNVTNPEAFRQ